MSVGTIVKALSGFYYVRNEDGLFQCRGRGNFRVRDVKPLVGDRVEFVAENPTDGYILDVFDRENELLRPPIANIDQVLLVFSAAEPDFSPQLLDRFLVHVEANDLEAVIIISKIDLLDKEKRQNIHTYQTLYEEIGYPVLLCSTKKQSSIEQLIPYLPDKVSVLAGQSGVGKSSLLNHLNPELNIETKGISTHLGRGKHTTRHVELIPICGGLVADTPGFSSLDFIDMSSSDLSNYFIEIKKHAAYCKFRGCTHTSEPGCEVMKRVKDGTINDVRFDHYKQFLEEINKQKKRYN